jgi:hypothetical protein
LVLRAGQNNVQIAFGAMLPGQAPRVVVLSECAGWVDPSKFDIGGRNAGEKADDKKSGPHGVTFGRVSR